MGVEIGRMEEMIAELGYEPVGFTSSLAALATFRAQPQRFEYEVAVHSARAHNTYRSHAGWVLEPARSS